MRDASADQEGASVGRVPLVICVPEIESSARANTWPTPLTSQIYTKKDTRLRARKKNSPQPQGETRIALRNVVERFGVVAHLDELLIDETDDVNRCGRDDD